MASNQFIARRGIISLDDAQITGSLSVTGNISSTTLIVTGGITGTATSASYVEYSNVANKPALISGSSQVSYTGLSNIPAGIVSGSTQVSFNGITDKPALVSSSAQIVGYNIFATTGSNQFNGSQAVTGSLTVTGQVVAQTLNVQQVTSSIVYSSGSNIFGNSLGNTQQFTGSVSVTGSLTVVTAGTELQVTSTGVNLGNALTDSHIISGSLRVNPNGLFVSGSGVVGIGTTSPGARLDVLSTLNIQATGNSDLPYINFSNNGRSFDWGRIGGLLQGDGDGALYFQTKLGGNLTEKMRITSGGNVGIGTTSPSEIFHVNKNNAGNIVGGYFTNSQANTGAESVSLAFGLNRSGGDFVRQIKAITFGAEQQWTGTESTVDGYLSFSTVQNEAVSERMRITSDGYLRMASGTGGIQFNGDTAAANALDDYEEGNWTPSIPGLTLSVPRATYVKIGSLVHVMATLSYVSGTGSGNVMNGLPFEASVAHRSGVSFGNINGISWGAGATAPFGFAYSTSIAFYGFANNAPYTTADFSTFDSGDFLEFSAVYHLN
jgi:hypothetical protein